MLHEKTTYPSQQLNDIQGGIQFDAHHTFSCDWGQCLVIALSDHMPVTSCVLRHSKGCFILLFLLHLEMKYTLNLFRVYSQYIHQVYKPMPTVLLDPLSELDKWYKTVGSIDTGVKQLQDNRHTGKGKFQG